MNRTIKDATVRVFHYEDLASLKAHVLAFVTAYNFAKHLKALRWKTPFQTICQAWTNDPDWLRINPHHLIPDHTVRLARHVMSLPPVAAMVDGELDGAAGGRSRWRRRCTPA